MIDFFIIRINKVTGENTKIIIILNARGILSENELDSFWGCLTHLGDERERLWMGIPDVQKEK